MFWLSWPHSPNRRDGGEAARRAGWRKRSPRPRVRLDEGCGGLRLRLILAIPDLFLTHYDLWNRGLPLSTGSSCQRAPIVTLCANPLATLGCFI
jgi:hypothetical protein